MTFGPLASVGLGIIRSPRQPATDRKRFVTLTQRLSRAAKTKLFVARQRLNSREGTTMSHENPQIRARAQARRARMHCHARESMSPRAPRALQGCLLGWAASSYFFESVPPLAYIFVQVPLDPPFPPDFHPSFQANFKSRDAMAGGSACIEVLL